VVIKRAKTPSSQHTSERLRGKRMSSTEMETYNKGNGILE